MGLFRINRELQFGVCIHGVLHASPHREGEEDYFYRREKEVGRAIVSKGSMAFHWLSLCQERKGVFLFPVGLCYHHKA